MPKRPDFLPVETAKGWMVSIPPGMTADGKRVRRFFKDRRKAEKLAGALRAQHHSGLRGSIMPAAVAQQAMAAVKLLEPLGMSLMEAARRAVVQLGGEAQRELFSERLARVLLDGEERWSSRYARDMEKVPRWLGEEAMGMRCGEMTEEVVTRLLRENGAAAGSTLAARMRQVKAVLGWKEKHRKQSGISIMTAEEVAALLEACRTPEETRAVGLLLFAGIRPDAEEGEIRRMDWSMVGTKEIYLPQSITKTGADRYIPITPRLRRMLKGHPKEGPCVPPNWKRVWRRLRAAAGIERKQDVCRHHFASHWLAAFGADSCQAVMGHTAGSRVLFEHYRRAVMEADGKAFFK